ncbi:CPBP family intramembrane metalloprotease [Flavobacteriaceae bacterium]|nr:CPBP family intramembrane metalloprotease [Flavobacteriaceae bacterium]
MNDFLNWIILVLLYFSSFLILISKENKAVLLSIYKKLLSISLVFVLNYFVIERFENRFLTNLSISSIAYFIFYYFSKRAFINFKLRKIRISYFILTILSSLCFSFIVDTVYEVKGYQNSNFFIIENGVYYALIFFCVLPAIFEEFFFRIIILEELLTIYSKKNAIIISSFFFAISHLIFHPLISFPYLFLMGILLATIMSKTKNITYSVIFHLTYNLFVFKII